jgi:20S proteasome subunit alpha 6
VKSKTHAVVAAIKRASSELSAYQKKIHPIDDHVGIAIAGLASDGRLLSKFMRTECLHHKYSYSEQLLVSKLVDSVGNKMQYQTQIYSRRPYGVGLIVAGYDEKGPHIFQTCPSANYYDCKAMAIGARSQSGRTYLERKLDEFHDSRLGSVVCCFSFALTYILGSWEQLIYHALRALRETLPNETELTRKNCSIGIVGNDRNFQILDDDAVKPYLAALEQMEREGATEEMQAEAEADATAETAGEMPVAGEGEDEPPAEEQMDVLQ